MAMYIVLEDDRTVGWHIGEAIPSKEAKFVTEVQADGDELNEVVRQITGLRTAHPDQRVVRWFGDDARFIIANLKADVVYGPKGKLFHTPNQR